MKRIFFLLSLFIFNSQISQAQEPYQFETVIDLDATPVESQGITGTCWSFSTSSFLESEIMRISGKQIDLSEMYSVRNTYPKKAWNYVMRQGKAQFSEGGLAHDVINVVKLHGLVPQQAYSGLEAGSDKHNHAEMVAVIKAMLDTYIDNPGRSLSANWKMAVESVLDTYLGKRPAEFIYDGKSYTPESFLQMTKLNPEDYVSITSFDHLPYYQQSILNIPDNFSNGTFYNLPLNEFMQVIDAALESGYTLSLDCDVSERGFSSKNGVAIVPQDASITAKAWTAIYPEVAVDQQLRQQTFESFSTTDDHLMHITGTLKDQKGNVYYKVKNSWGTSEDRTAFGGYVYFSESYMRLKSISVMVHKDALPDSIAKVLKF